MTCADLTAAPGPCPCGTPHFPVQICNPPHQPSVLYRAGDYLAFRHKLLRQLPGETQLTQWQPGAEGDLAVQMVEWWAYVADVLTFYNERIANEAYLKTATQPESVNHLIQTLGYRPRPALGSKVTLAGVLATGARPPVALPKGLRVQSKPGPGQAPQIFELDQAATLTAPDVVASEVVAKNQALLADPAATRSDNTLWLAGKVAGLKPGEKLLLINAKALAAAPEIDGYAWIAVTGSRSAKTPLGEPVTALSFTPVASTLAAGAKAGDYVLLRSKQASPLWSFPTTSDSITRNLAAVTGSGGGITLVEFPTSTLNLAGLARSLTPGALLLLDPDGVSALTPTACLVQSYAEAFWYANCGAGAAATTAPAQPPAAIGIPISAITTGNLDGLDITSHWTDKANWPSISVRYAFTRVGDLVPVQGAADLAYPGGGTSLRPLTTDAAYPAGETTVLLEDASGAGVQATLTPAADGSAAVTISPAQAAVTLASPIDAMFNLLPFSRGKSVPLEVLGSGSPIVAGQDFKLKNAPVTYFADAASISGENFSSTVQVSVNNVLWREVQSFYGQPPNAQVYVLREDDAGQTHVSFGDGINGALLPTGTNNVAASYRYGAGAAAPAVDTISVVLNPQPGLKKVRNPVAPTGGGDADSPERLRGLAPQSVLTFNRAVSKDDYVAIALTAGVSQAAADYVFDPISQRPKITLWVTGDAGALAAVEQAVTGRAMPGQGLSVQLATPVEMALSLSFLCDSELDAPAIKTALTAALGDPDRGLLGAASLGIGQVVYDSQIEAACLQVPGVQAVHNLSLESASGAFSHDHFVLRLRRRFHFGGLRVRDACAGRRHDPGAGCYFVVSAIALNPVVAGVAA